jgi:hypothetical protein
MADTKRGRERKGAGKAAGELAAEIEAELRLRAERDGRR